MAQIHPLPILPDLARIADDLQHAGPFLLAALASLVAGCFAVRVLVHSRCQSALARGARMIEVSAPPVVEPGAGQALWANLLGLHRPRLSRCLRGQPHLAFELAADPEGLRIRMWVPATVPPGLVEHAVESAWPGARTTVLDQVPALVKAAATTRIEAGRLIPARSQAVPLRVKFDTDPLRPLLGTFGALARGEAGYMQILARPASPRRTRRLRRTLAALSGRPGTTTPSLGRILAGLGPGPTPSRTVYNSPAPWRDARTDADARAAAGKLAGPLWEAELRYAAVVTAPGSPQAKAASERIGARARGLAGEIASTMNVYAERNHLRRRHLHRPARHLDSRAFGRGSLYSIAEMAALAHLPFDAVVPGLSRAGARPVPPSIQIPTGPSTGRPVKILGDADAGPSRAVALPVADSRHHMHVIGTTGSGKSTLLANLALQDVAAGRGTVVIDPKGDIIDDILERLPIEAADKTVLFDPELDAPPPRINPFDGADPAVAVDNLTSIFQRIYAGFWGPRSDDLLRASCLTLIAASRNEPTLGTPTLAHIPTLLTSEPVRRRYLKALTSGNRQATDNAVLAGFWAWYEQLSAPSQAHATAPLLNKLRAFLLRDFAAATVATGSTNVDLADVLDGGICLVRLPKGVLGVETTRLLGSFVLAKYWQAATARARRSKVRRDSSLTVDEGHNFLNLATPLEEMFAEARGFNLSITFAHQNLAQLPSDLREGLSANARNKIVFSVSPEDAHALERHTLPLLGAHDLANLDAFQAAARITVSAAEQPVCTLRTRALPEPAAGRADQIRALIAARTRQPAA